MPGHSARGGGGYLLPPSVGYLQPPPPPSGTCHCHPWGTCCPSSVGYLFPPPTPHGVPATPPVGYLLLPPPWGIGYTHCGIPVTSPHPMGYLLPPLWGICHCPTQVPSHPRAPPGRPRSPHAASPHPPSVCTHTPGGPQDPWGHPGPSLHPLPVGRAPSACATHRGQPCLSCPWLVAAARQGHPRVPQDGVRAGVPPVCSTVPRKGTTCARRDS